MKLRSFFMLGILAGVFLAAASFGTAEVDAQELKMAADGKSPYRIVLPDGASAVEGNAAGEFQLYFEQITGAKLPIAKESELNGESGPFVFVGTSEMAKKEFPELTEIDFREDEIFMKSDADGHLVLTGDARRGALYAVVTFLEDELGCRWWTSTESTIPRKPTLTVRAQDHRFAPPMVYREAYYRDAFEEKFAVHSKVNGNMARISEEWGGKNRFVFFVHSFYPLIPPVKYFKDHPEWFSEIDGVRKVGIPSWSGPGSAYEEFAKTLKPEQIHASGTQLCLANDEMRAELTKNALEHLRKNPGAKFISISQNDWRGYCTCEKCRAIDEANESPSGSLITFVNKVAEDIEKEFPDVFVETLAYQYTRKPPKLVKPRKNVVVRLCTIECSFLQPLESGELNKTLADDIRGWSAIAPQLFVWNYITNFTNYILPHPNMRCLAPDIRFFVKNKTIGLFNQGDVHTTCGDFVSARNWVVAHLLWDPDRDETALWKEFFTNYYGPAAEPLLEYLNVIHDRADTTGFNLRCYLENTRGWLDAETILKAAPLVEKARAVVKDDPTLALRVEKALVAYDFNWLQRWHEMNFYCKVNAIPFPGPKDPRAAAEKFCAFLEAQDSTHYRESLRGQPWADLRSKLIGSFPVTPAAKPDMNAVLPEQETSGKAAPDWDSVLWIDFQDAMMRIGGREKGWGEWVDAPKASDGRAIRMPGWHFEWAASCPFPPGLDLKNGKKWRVYGAVRCEASTEEGSAMTCGIYDWKEKKSVSHRNLSVKAIQGETYRLVDLGAHALTDTMYIWFAPPKRDGEVQNVYVDRFFLVEE